jgi:tetratricopeptide (TPR) repeat protein
MGKIRQKHFLLFSFDPEKHILSLGSEFEKRYRIELPFLEKVPEWLYENRIIQETSLDACAEMFRGFYGDKKKGTCIIRINVRNFKKPDELAIRWEKLYCDHTHRVIVLGIAEPMSKVKTEIKCRKEHLEFVELKKELKRQEDYLKKAEVYQKELRRYRHDRKNNLIALFGMLNSGDIEGAKRYLQESVTILNVKSSIVNTGNPSLDTVLSEKIQEAKLHGIQVHQMIGLPPNVAINLRDLCLAIGNCLDNAIEACCKAKRIFPDSFITFELIEKHNVITFRMENSSVTPTMDEDENLKTSKRDKKNHGFGLKNVRAIVEKYHGYIEAVPMPGVFHIAFTLFLNETV